ncbi:hypothetical protein AKJ09_05650 [Labilithrix luteola]|uniref:Large extracellular alpha-helical protein n=1 Tax=Labilithrix luteola TaxID=1391654 RepID=A0A0K1Q020_9BACT|nr:hypothetical protein AKJ09_05650 [Labilithrix luteola]
MGFRISNADEEADNAQERKLAPATPLGADDAKRLVARLPQLPRDAEDEKAFSMRDKSIPAPRAGKTVSEAFPPPAGPPPTNVPPKGPLTVERHEPEGKVEIAPHVTVTFSQPMVPITSVDELAKDKAPITLTPQPEGKWRWLGTRTLLFQPEKRMPMATEYTVEVPSGTKAANGETLNAATRWTFTTPPPTVKRTWPTDNSVALEPIVFVEFDQAIDAGAMLASIELRSARGSVPVKLAEPDEIEGDDTVRRLSQQAEKGRWVAFKPTTKLSTSTGYTVVVKKGAKSAEGPRTTASDQTSSFVTFGPLKVVKSQCGWGKDCAPLQPFTVTFSNPIDLGKFDTSMVKASPEIPAMKVEVHQTYMTISGRTKGRTKYAVDIAKSITDVHQQTMDEPAHLTFDVGPAEPTMFGAENPMVVLDPAAPKQYVVYSINEPALHARVYAVTPEDYKKYIEFSNEWERPRKITPPGKLVFDKTITPKKSPDEVVGTPIDLGAALNGGFGQVLVVVEPTRTLPKGWQRPELHVWIQATELGLAAYAESDRVTGWVTKLTDGSPIDDVEVSLLGEAPVKTQGGIARLPLTKTTMSLVVARKGKDVAIVGDGYAGNPLPQRQDQLRWLVFDDRGMYKPGEELRVKGWLRRVGTGRGGDIDAVPSIEGQTVRYRVRDPRWAEIGTGEAKVDSAGAFDFAYKLPANANLGSAHIELVLEGSRLEANNYHHRFEVQEFRRPEFEVNAKASEGPHYVGGHAVATVTASYYAGGGLPNAPVEWHVTRSTGSFAPPNRTDFHFGPEPRLFWDFRGPSKAEETKTETWSSRTNPQGVHRIRLDFDALEPSYPMSLQLTGQVEDVNRQQWAGRTTMLVHPSDTYVGVRLGKNFVRAGENIDVDLLAANIEGKLVGGRPIVVKAARLDWQQKGTEYVEKEVDVQTCETTSNGGENDKPARCSLKTTEGGRYRVWAVVTDEHGRKNQSATTLYVTGKDVPKDRGVTGDRITVIPDKKEYKPGETAEVLVVAPFLPAEGILTVRRQGIVQLERFTMKDPSQVLKVKLDEPMVPNVEIHVDLVGAAARADSSIKRPAFGTGSVTVNVLPVSRTLAVKAEAKKPTLEPGGATSIEVDVKDAQARPVRDAEVAVIVVDEAVLALSGKKTPDPVSVFYSERYSDVSDVGLRDRIVLADPDLLQRGNLAAEGTASGGGIARPQARMAAGAPMAPPAPAPMASAAELSKSDAAFDKKVASRDEAVSANNTPIQVRTDFGALALFSPRVRTDGSGKATVPVKLPDNLTRYRVMAVASAGDKQFGANESTITARLPLMVRPSAPRFLNFGDRFELPVIVQNQTDSPVDVGVVARAVNATVEEPSAKRVTIPPNDRVEVRFNAAAEKAGTARFQIGIAAKDFADASQITLPVYTPATTEAFATYGEIDDGAIAQPVKMPPNVFPQFGGLEITTSSTQLQALTDAVLYLVKYPFECNEQIASRVLAVASLKDVLSAFKAEGLPSPEVLTKSMTTDFEKLQRHQNGNGGWGFWQEQPWPYLSVHVTHALVRAKEKGFQPNAVMLSRAQSYLRSIESQIPSWYPDDARRAIIAYALFVRKKMGDADPARAKRLITEAGGLEKLPIEAVGWIWPILSQDKASAADNEAIRRHVQNRVTETAGAAHFVSGYKDADWLLLHSDRRADGVLLESMIGDQPQSSVIPKLVKGLLGHRKAGHWTNTQENAFVLLALDRYFATYEKVTPDFVARVWLGDRFAGQHAFKGRTTESSETKVPMQWLASELKSPQSLVLGKDGPGRLYYRIGMQYAPTDLKLPPTDQGFVVSRTYEGADKPEDVRRDADGTWRVKAGTKVRVRVSMVAQSRRYHVALVDPIPAGLEPLNPALAVTGEIPKDPKVAEDAAKRGGRYWYWDRTWYEHQNMRDERVEAFASLLWDGVWDYTYVAKATTPGVYVVPPPKAEEMYSPETFGRGRGDRFIVE